VARLAMDVDGAREVGRPPVVDPVVIREPRALSGDGDELARARMVEAGGALPLLVEDARDAILPGEERPHRAEVGRIADVDVGDGRNRRIGGPQALEVVVEVREVDEREPGRLALDDAARGAGDPAARVDVRSRPPEAEERERAERALEVLLEPRRLRVDPGDL